MDLREALSLLPNLHYDRSAPKTQPAQQELYRLRREPPAGLPIGLDVRVSGQGINLPVVPWITLLDPSVTKKVTEGLYLVYLFAADLQSVFLTMNQGATQHKNLHKDAGLGDTAAESAAIQEIANETAQIRGVLLAEAPDLPVDGVQLGSSLFLPRAYEAGTIACRRYDLGALPTEQDLRAELSRFDLIYRRSVEIKDQLVAADPQHHRTTARSRSNAPGVDPEPVFRPKDGADYLRNLPGRRTTVSPRHESLIREFGEHVGGLGWTPATNVHPRDLVVTSPAGDHWLVEAKTVGPNAEFAVREAIGQLFAYRHFCYRDVGRPEPRLLALFNEPVGDAFLPLLGDLGIEVVWRTTIGWNSTSGAAALLLSPP